MNYHVETRNFSGKIRHQMTVKSKKLLDEYIEVVKGSPAWKDGTEEDPLDMIVYYNVIEKDWVSVHEQYYPDKTGDYPAILVYTMHGYFKTAEYKWNKKDATYSWYWDGEFRNRNEVAYWMYLTEDDIPKYGRIYHPNHEKRVVEHIRGVVEV